MTSTDIVSYYIANWNPVNTSGSTPKICYHPDWDELGDGNSDVSTNWNRGMFLKNISDKAEEIGIQRTHMNEESVDVYECTLVDFSFLELKKLLKEVRRIALLNLTDDLHTWLDFEDAPIRGQNNRKYAVFNLLFIKAGISFDA